MPNAPTHDRIALIAAPVIALPSYAILTALGDSQSAALTGSALIVGAHLVGSWMLSPDLDLDSAIDNRWGILRPIWIPYRRLVPHRHWFSHSGISGVFRLLYLYIILSLLLLFATAIAHIIGFGETNYAIAFSQWLWDAGQQHTRIALLIITGVILSDAIHVITDYTSSAFKRRWGRRRRRRT